MLKNIKEENKLNFDSDSCKNVLDDEEEI